MKFLSTLDICIIALYFAILLVISWYLKKRANSSMDNYFLAGRKLPWWLLGIGNMAAYFDMTGTMIITSFLYLLGPRGLYIEFRGGAGLVLAFLMIFTGKWHRRSGVMTGAEWIGFRFGDDRWGKTARIASAISWIVFVTGILAYSFKGAGLFLSMFLPFSPLVCSVGLVLITTLYTMESGFYGVIFTDIFQSICIWACIVFVTAIAIARISGVDDFAAVAASVTGNRDWMTSLPQWHTEMPKGYEQYSMLALVGIFYLAKTVPQSMSSGADPKYFAARSDKDCGLLSFMAGWLMTLRWPLMMSFAVLGILLAKDLFPDQSVMGQAAEVIKTYAGPVTAYSWPEVTAKIMNHPQLYPAEMISKLQVLLGSDWASKLSMISYNGTVDPERILPGVILFNIPFGIRGLILVGLLAAGMSTFNAFTNMATGYFTRDLYQGFIRQHASNNELMAVNRLFAIAISAVALLLAYITPNINSIWGWLMMGFMGGMTVPQFLRLFWWRFNGAGYAAGMFIGLLAAILQRMLLPGMIEWQQFLYVWTVGLAAAVLMTYATSPTDTKVLENFYLKTRPFGLWRPFKKLLSPELLKATEKEHRNDIAAIPFALCWQISLLLMATQLVIGAYTDMLITSLFCGIGLLGLYLFWYRQLATIDRLNPEEEHAKHAIGAKTNV